MAIQIRADETSEIIRSQIQGSERNLLPLCDLSNLCISANDTNNRMARTSKMNIIWYNNFLFSTLVPPATDSGYREPVEKPRR
jgi:hypothetical protein